MAILFDVLYRTLSILRGERNGISTGPETPNKTSLYDSALVELNDYLNGGTIFMLSGLNINTSRVITDWNSSTFVFTFSAMTYNNSSGMYYAAFDNRYTRQDIVQAVNRALQLLGPFDEKDETITTTADTERYALTAGVANIKRVQYATSTTSPYDWSDPRHDWYERNGYLYFRDYTSIPSGRLLRLTYGTYSSRLQADSDTIPSQVDPERLAAEAAYEAAKARSGKGGQSDPETQVDLTLSLQYRNEARMRFPIRKLHPDSKYSISPW